MNIMKNVRVDKRVIVIAMAEDQGRDLVNLVILS